MNYLTTITRKMIVLVLAIAMTFVGTNLCFADSEINNGPADEQISKTAAMAFEPLRWGKATEAVAFVYTSGKKVYAEASIKPNKDTYAVKGYLYLEQKSGRTWKEVKSWRINETGAVSLSKSYAYTKGNIYRARLEVTVSGEKINVISDELEI